MKNDRFHFKLGVFTLAGITLAVLGIGYLGGERLAPAIVHHRNLF